VNSRGIEVVGIECPRLQVQNVFQLAGQFVPDGLVPRVIEVSDLVELRGGLPRAPRRLLPATEAFNDSSQITLAASESFL
jgi:hypothetical protein